MPRKILPQVSTFPFHIGNRTVNKMPFPIPMNRVWKIMCEELTYCSYSHDLKILSFVLMPNHFHLIAISDSQPLGLSMMHFLKTTSLRINQESGRINHLWGRRYWKTLLHDSHYFFNTYKYVYQNPMRANLVNFCEEWPYSSLHALLGLSKLDFPLQEDTILFPNQFNEKELLWLNTIIDKKDLSDIRTALKTSYFKYPRREGFKNPLHLKKI